VKEISKFYPNRTIGGRVMTSFPRLLPQHHKSTPGYRFGDVPQLKTLKSIYIGPTTFRQRSSVRGEILVFPVFENKRTPYWNSTSGVHFDVFGVISMWFCIGTPNIKQTGPKLTSRILHISGWRGRNRVSGWSATASGQLISQ